MDKILLKMVSLLNPLLQKTGVDTLQLNEILRIKLLMDNRRPKTIFGNKKAKEGSKASSSIFSNIMVVVMGLMMSFVLFISKMPLAGQTLYFSIFMVMMALTLISDFTTVLIDTRDQFIISPRPVNDRTVAMARFLHITLYVTRIALLQGLPGILLVAFIDGSLAIPVFFVQVIEATLLSVLLVNLVYFILIKLVNPQRFKDIISYVQIAFSICIFAVYYLVPKLINISSLKHIDLLSHTWVYFLPPVWISSLNEILFHAAMANLTMVLLAITGLITPIIGIWFVAKVLAPGFNRSLAIINTADGNSVNAATAKKQYKIDFRDKLANLIAPEPIENAGFKITWKLAARTREFKMKVFPAFAYVPIYFLYFAFNGKGASLSEKYETMKGNASYIFLIYLTTFVLSSILQNVSQSAKYKSAWVYYTLPIDQPGKILAGMYKAIIVLYFIPYCLILSITTIIIWGPITINDILLAFSLSTIYGMLMALFLVKGLPFSKPIMVKAGGGKMIVSFVIMGFIVALGFGHRFLIKWETLIWALIIPAILINWIMFNQYKKQTWDAIELADMDG
jgi:ABC-2 type transport system permease protein